MQQVAFSTTTVCTKESGEPAFLYHYGDIIYDLILTGGLLCDIMFFMKPKPYSESQPLFLKLFRTRICWGLYGFA